MTVTKQLCQRRLSGLGGLWVTYDRREGPLYRTIGIIWGKNGAPEW